jgi:hypothetical protein
MKKITKKKAVALFESGEKIYSCRRTNGQQSILWDPAKTYVSIQSLLDRDGRIFDFCIKE